MFIKDRKLVSGSNFQDGCLKEKLFNQSDDIKVTN